MTNSIAKGKKGEREWSNFLKDHGYEEARRGQQFKGGGDSPDVVGLPGIHQEVKRVEKLQLWPSIEQSERDAAEDEIPIVVHRPNRRPWIVIMNAEDFLDIYNMARCACYEGCSPIPEREFNTFRPW